MKFAKTACLGLLVLAACSSANEKNTFGNKPGSSGGAGGDETGAGGSSGSGTAGSGGAGTAGSSGGGLGLEGGLGGSGNGGGSGTSCQYADSTDHDGDGYSFADGDLNDCDTNVNPGAFDVPGNNVDEDCNGTPDDEPTGCDVGLPIDGPDPFMGAKSIGLCRQADPAATGKDKTWGVLTAAWVKPDKSPEKVAVSHGVLPKFGVNNPQEGTNMLGLSSGSARDPSQPGYHDVSGYDKGYTSGTPAGYPKESPACPGVKTGTAHDGAGLLLTIRVPTNAKSFTFNENFFTYEFPGYICSQFNDFFVAMLEPKVPTLLDGNISFDQDGNPVSVNNSLLQVCIPESAGGKYFPCPLGVSGIAGTGFDAFGQAHAATGWLQTQAPVTPGSVITLLFAIWDSGDGFLDSSVLIDNFQWSVDAGTDTPTTTPVPTPK